MKHVGVLTIYKILLIYVYIYIYVVHFLVWIINFHSQLQGWSYLLLFTMVTTDTIHKITSQETATKLVLISTGNYSAFGNVVPAHHTTRMEVISPRMLNFGTCWRCVASYPTALYLRRRRNKAHALAQNQTPVVFCPHRHYTELLRLVPWSYYLAPESKEHLQFNELSR